MPTHSGRAQRLIAAWDAAWNHGDLDPLDELIAPHYVRHTRSSVLGQDREEFKNSIITSRTAFPDLRTRVEDLIEDGDRVASRWRAKGTHTGPFRGIASTGRVVEFAGATFTRYKGRTVTEEWVAWDPRELLYALGTIPLGEHNEATTR